ncbi:serine acetyltransferase [Mesorhizobium sp. B2-3-10]|uniref:serine acetyltransferase n=1 Tax=Mesorhizobium sp. B2-3-10 TaxID=2589954 RepID=UPI0015E43420|nr:serine acetyltransferase [Mesorhizobium sp. B2-3-10]
MLKPLFRLRSGSLGKGEVESSILSRSTRHPANNAACDTVFPARTGDEVTACAGHRIAQSDNSVVCRIARLFLSLKMRKFGIQIPVETSIGHGFYIGHGGPCVVHHTATIGNNCNISQYVTIGATLGKSASIGNEVYIGPNVCIVEEVTIGSRSLIGAGAVVTRNIPAGSTAVGVPARPIDKARQHNFITNRWPPAM